MVEDRHEVIRAACRKKITFFADQYVWTEDPQAEDTLRKWPSFGYLSRALEEFRGAKILVVYKKSRQMLLSWCACVYAIWFAGFFASRQIMIQSTKEEAAKGLIQRMEFILAHLPEYLLPCSYTANAGKITFHHKHGTSWIMAVPSGANQIRSWSPTVVIFDESAWQEDIRKAHAAARPAVRGGGQIIHISTPGEADKECAEYFKNLCQGGKNKVLELHYSMMPGATPEWAAKIREEYGYEDDQWAREMEGSFNVGGGKPVFKPPFNREQYVQPLGYNPALDLIVAVDYGVRHPAAVWFQFIPYTFQIYCLRTVTGDDITLPQFAQQLIAMTKALIAPVRYTPSLKMRMYDDPAGQSRKDTGGPTSRQAMNAAGLYPCNSSKKVMVRESVMLVRERLQPRVGQDLKIRPGMLFDPSCVNLIDAMDGKYAEDEKVPDKYKGGITQHEVDALRYGLAGFLRLGDR